MPDQPDTSSVPPTLEYQSPGETSAEDHKHIETLRGVCGAIFAMAYVLFIVAFFITSNYEFDVPRPPGPLNIAGPFIAATVIFAILISIAIFQYRVRKSIAFARGMLIGFGFGILLEGFCFIALKYK